MRRPIAIAAAALIAAAAAPADVRISAEDGANHAYPAVCRQPFGFVAAWESDGDDGREVTVQRLSGNGRELGAPFRANQENAGDQQLPDIACRADGSFLLVWESRGQDGDGLGIFARDFAGDGTPRGDELRVNTHTADNQHRPRVCVDDSGRAVVVWQSHRQVEQLTRVYGQRLDADAAPLAGEFAAAELSDSAHADPAVACREDGAFVVAWQSSTTTGSQIVARLFDGDGAPVNTALIPDQADDIYRRHVALAPISDGIFALAFESDGAIHLGTVEIDSGSAVADVVPLPAARRSEAPAVAVRDAERILAAWSSGSIFEFAVAGVRARYPAMQSRSFTVDSTRRGNRGALSTIGRGIDIATAHDGDLVVWQQRDVGADDSTSAIWARRFRDCIGDCSDDGVVAINELITGVRIALNEVTVDTCARFDANGSGLVEVNELIRAVNEALARICPAPVNWRTGVRSEE